MALINFQTRFAAAVAAGLAGRPAGKRQTIRARRKHPIKVGEVLHLYTGCRTKAARKLGEARCASVQPVEISRLGVKVDGEFIEPEAVAALALADGFADWEGFMAWFVTDKQPTFNGELIKW